MMQSCGNMQTHWSKRVYIISGTLPVACVSMTELFSDLVWLAGD